ncbi:MAG: HAD-IA family hydrolase, partial [Oceanidesulfovibrio sp.]
GARLVATNADAALPVAGGLQPECGAVVAFLETAGGCTAHVAGKPNPEFFHLGMALLDCAPEETLMIGDTLETDILGASRAGVRSALVATGNPVRRGGADGADIIPTVSVADLGELRRLMEMSRTS